MTDVIDRTIVKQYFKGSIGPIILIIIGALTAVFTFFLVLIAGIAWLIIDKFKVSKDAEAMIDELIQIETRRLEQRALEKLNIVQEQVKIIDPIYLYGPSYDPNPQSSSGNGVFAKMLKQVSNSLNKSDDPIWRSKVGSDGVWRYSLVEVTVLFFDESQMFIYYAYLDLTTGAIFEEGTYEYFYQDVLSINLNQKQVKVFDPKKKTYDRKLFEYLTIYTAGCSHKSSYSTKTGSSHIDAQFTAMRNLIRDKKVNGSHLVRV